VLYGVFNCVADNRVAVLFSGGNGFNGKKPWTEILVLVFYGFSPAVCSLCYSALFTNTQTGERE
jgi:hypothetical protein